MSVCPTVGAKPSPASAGHSPFQRGDAFVPARGPPGGEAGPGLPGPVPMPGRVLSLPSALGVPAVIGLGPRRERGDLKAIIEDAKGKLAVSLWQREQVLVHILWRGCSECASPTDSRGQAGTTWN